MLDSILITLDGSKHAEDILDYVPSFAGAVSATQISLLRVCEGESELKDTEAYLQEKVAVVVKSLGGDGASTPKVEGRAIHRGRRSVADVILECAVSQDVDVTMAATHGWTGADWSVVGGVADSILSATTLPVLLVRPAFGRNPARLGKVERILVPLDGSQLAEEALPYARYLGQKTGAEVSIFHSKSSHEEVGPELTGYLDRIAASLAEQGAKTKPVLRRGSPPGLEIALEVEERDINLVVMSSHGETGATEGAFGSVASAVLHGSHVPVLIVPCR